MQNETATQSYSFARAPFTRERTFRLAPDALLWDDGNRSGRLPYAEIATVHLYYRSEPYGRGMQVCALRSRSGAKLAIQSKHFGRWGRQDDRSAAFAPFVRALLGRVAVAAPEARCFSGFPVGLYYAVLAAFVVLALIFLANLAFALQGSAESGSGAIVAAILLLALFPSGWRNLRGCWPRPSSPQQLADDLPRLKDAA
jgi:hypothetical protein